MGMLVDLTDRRFGWLVVVSRATPTEHLHRLAHWTCRCRCGRTLVVRSDALRDGTKRSCGECAIEYRLRAVFQIIDRRTTEAHFAK